jgi:calcium-dependent protein kinase
MLADGNGDVEFIEFLAGLARLRSDSDEALKMCFDIFDADKSGFLSRDELMRLLTSNGIDLGATSSDLGADESRAIRLADMFSRMDSNHDEKISFEEFRRALHSDPIVAEAVLKPLREQAAR